MVELCKQRMQALQLDEDTLLKKAQDIGIGKFKKSNIERNFFF